MIFFFFFEAQITNSKLLDSVAPTSSLSSAGGVGWGRGQLLWTAGTGRTQWGRGCGRLSLSEDGIAVPALGPSSLTQAGSKVYI